MLISVASALPERIAVLLTKGHVIAEPGVGLVSSVEHETCIDDADCDAGCGGQRRKRLVHCHGVVSAAGRACACRTEEVVAVAHDVHMPVPSHGRQRCRDLAWMQTHNRLTRLTLYRSVA